MSRTTIEIPMVTNNIDAVLKIVERKLRFDGYTQKIVDGETIWAQGDGVITAMQCIGIIFTGKSVLVQGWVKDAIMGESNLDGFFQYVPKKRIRSLIDEINAKIVQDKL